ncbi:nucleotidyltransferase family protein [Jannaschia formosa]|uniref:nucleotidyltransferase family protein n=1 Tax=Jannaschia formosa TaxID=2259592 RepID=UPI000E1B59F2|nr:nucleotidyltransferase family protein [Jannaschia formosa]TFL20147.1 nucleotidyltransferase family protein [Jannaschia formosa]
MIFAAGKGTRMQPLTDTRPKALVEVAGRPLIEHALDQVAGPGPLVVNTHHRAAQLESHLAGRPGVATLREEVLLETGGGLRNALPLLGTGPVLTMNADAVWTGPRARDTLLAHWRPEAMDGLLLMVPRSRALGQAGGSFALGGDGRLVRDREGLVYTGAGIVKTEGLAAFPDTVFSLRELWFAMLAEGRLSGCVHPGHWADVGTPDGIALAEAMLGQTA